MPASRLEAIASGNATQPFAPSFTTSSAGAVSGVTVKWVNVWGPGDANEIVCAVGGGAETVNEFDTGVAAAKPRLPAWLAVTVQVPTATSVSVVPLTVQTPVVVDAKLTTKPELALAARGAGAVPRVWLPGGVNVMVCAINGAAATVNERVTGVAAE